MDEVAAEVRRLEMLKAAREAAEATLLAELREVCDAVIGAEVELDEARSRRQRLEQAVDAEAAAAAADAALVQLQKAAAVAVRPAARERLAERLRSLYDGEADRLLRANDDDDILNDAAPPAAEDDDDDEDTLRLRRLLSGAGEEEEEEETSTEDLASARAQFRHFGRLVGDIGGDTSSAAAGWEDDDILTLVNGRPWAAEVARCLRRREECFEWGAWSVWTRWSSRLDVLPPELGKLAMSEDAPLFTDAAASRAVDPAAPPDPHFVRVLDWTEDSPSYWEYGESVDAFSRGDTFPDAGKRDATLGWPRLQLRRRRWASESQRVVVPRAGRLGRRILELQGRVAASELVATQLTPLVQEALAEVHTLHDDARRARRLDDDLARIRAKLRDEHAATRRAETLLAASKRSPVTTDHPRGTNPAKNMSNKGALPPFVSF